MKTSKLNTFLSTFHLVLLFVGYQVATTIFLPVTSDIEGISRTVTVPYRGFALLLAMLVLMLNFKRKVKYPPAIKVLFFYWVILIIRIIYDLYIRSDVYINSEEKFRLLMFIFAMTIIPMFAVIKSYKYINLEKAFKWIVGLTLLSVSLSFFSNELLQSGVEERVSSNAGMASIGTGHFGVTGILLALFLLLKRKQKLFLKLIVIFGIILSTFMFLRAGSRGPLLAFMVVIAIWILASSKNTIKSFGIFFLIISISLLGLNTIMNFIKTISPIMFARLNQSDHLVSRWRFFDYAVQSFLENPFLGKQFAIFHGDGTFIYAHNILLDSLMGLGIIGGLCMLYFILISFKSVFVLIKTNNSHFWIGLIMLQQIMYNMVSGAFYLNPLLSILFVCLFLIEKKQNL